MGRLNEIRRRGTGPIAELRGRGLWVGVELPFEPGPIIDACRELGMLVTTAGEKVVRFAPALIIEHSQLGRGGWIFSKRALKSHSPGTGTQGSARRGVEEEPPARQSAEFFTGLGR